MSNIRKTAAAVLAFLWVSFCLLPSAGLAAGQSGSCGDSAVWTLDSYGTLTISGTGAITAGGWDINAVKAVVVKPGITTIGSSTFEYNENLGSVSLPEGLETIGSYAFHKARYLESVTIPSTVTSVPGNAFYCCFGLKKINVASGNTAYCSRSGVLYTRDMTELVCYPIARAGDTYTVPSSVVRLGDYSFDKTDLREIILPNGLKYIGYRAFAFCYLLESLSIPSGVTTISGMALCGCDKMTDITLPAALNQLGDDVFIYTPLENIYVESGNKTYRSVGGVLFSSDLKRLVAYPGRRTGSYSIPEGTEEIGYSAFYDAMVSGVTIPASVNQIRYSAFSCANLQNVSVKSGNTAYCSVGGVLFSADRKTLVYFPGARTGSYSVPKGTKVIDLRAFYESHLTEVVLPDSVVDIENCAFQYASLKKITLPGTLETVMYSAFSSCYLEEVNYTGSRVDWENMTVYSGNETLLSATRNYIGPVLTLPAGLKRVEAQTFAGVKNALIVLPPSITYIAAGAFDASVTVECSGGYAAQRCEELGLKYYTVPRGKTGARRQRSGRKLPLLRAAASAAGHSSAIFRTVSRRSAGFSGMLFPLSSRQGAVWRAFPKENLWQPLLVTRDFLSRFCFLFHCPLDGAQFVSGAGRKISRYWALSSSSVSGISQAA